MTKSGRCDLHHSSIRHSNFVIVSSFELRHSSFLSTRFRMQLRKRRLKKAGKRQGAMLVLIAITLIIFVIALVFSIDVAYMQLVRSQLRAAADAAARAGAQTLSTAQDENAAVKKAID